MEEVFLSPTNSTPRKSKPRFAQMSTGELQEYLRSRTVSRSSMYSSRVPQSASYKESSYSSAMRALQQKLRSSQCENQDLKERLKVAQMKTQTDYNYIQKVQKNDVQIAKSRWQDASNQKLLLEEKLRGLMGENQQLTEKLKIKTSQIEFSYSCIQREEQQRGIDQENFRLQIELLEKKVNEKIGQEKSLYQEMQAKQREKESIKEEILQQKRIIKSRKAEISYLRGNSEAQRIKLQKQYEVLEKELKEESKDYSQKLKKVQAAHNKLKGVNSNQEKQIEYLKKQIKEFLEPQKKGHRVSKSRSRLSTLTQSTPKSIRNQRQKSVTFSTPIRAKTPTRSHKTLKPKTLK